MSHLYLYLILIFGLMKEVKIFLIHVAFLCECGLTLQTYTQLYLWGSRMRNKLSIKKIGVHIYNNAFSCVFTSCFFIRFWYIQECLSEKAHSSKKPPQFDAGYIIVCFCLRPHINNIYEKYWAYIIWWMRILFFVFFLVSRIWTESNQLYSSFFLGNSYDFFCRFFW